jgi:hypothetical protein
LGSIRTTVVALGGATKIGRAATLAIPALGSLHHDYRLVARRLSDRHWGASMQGHIEFSCRVGVKALADW